VGLNHLPSGIQAYAKIHEGSLLAEKRYTIEHKHGQLPVEKMQVINKKPELIIASSGEYLCSQINLSINKLAYMINPKNRTYIFVHQQISLYHKINKEIYLSIDKLANNS